jgi:hypothetical protein
VIDTKGLNMNIVRLLAQARVVGSRELPAIVNHARIIMRLAHENPGEVFPQPIEEMLGLWQTVAQLADEAGRPEVERRTCNNCRFMWDSPRNRPAETQKEADERVCTVDPPADKPRVCFWDRPACSRWEVKL